MKVKNILLLLGLFLLAIAPVLVWWWWGTGGVGLMASYWVTDQDSTRLSALGQTGDLFGGINALFAAYAFAGVAVAAYFQWRSWQLFLGQREQEAFEPLFFHLLQLNRELKPKELRFNSPDPAGKVETVIDALQLQIFPLLPNFLTQSQTERRDAVKNVYLPLYWANESQLGPYLRALFHTFRRIKTSRLKAEQKLEYVRIARATLDKNDLFLLLMNCTTELGKDFKPLVEEYGLFKHIPRSPEIEPPTGEQQLADSLYEKSAVLSTRKRREFWSQNKNIAEQLNVDMDY